MIIDAYPVYGVSQRPALAESPSMLCSGIYTHSSLSDNTYSSQKRQLRESIVLLASSTAYLYSTAFTVKTPVKDEHWNKFDPGVMAWTYPQNRTKPDDSICYWVQTDSNYRSEFPRTAITIDYNLFQKGLERNNTKYYVCVGFVEDMYEQSGLDVTPNMNEFTESTYSILFGLIDIVKANVFFPKFQRDHASVSIPKPPEIEITEPVFDATVGNLVTLKGYARDVSMIRADKIKLEHIKPDGLTEMIEADIDYADNCSFSVSLPNLEEGEHKFKIAEAFDKAGNEATTFCVDNDNDGQKDAIYKFTINSPPKVVATTPSDGNVNVSISGTNKIVAVFDQSMSTGTVVNAFSISPSVPGTFEFSSDNNIVTYHISNHPEQYLHYNSTYTVTIKATAASAAGLPLDGNGNGISEGSPTDDYSFTFVTEPPDFALDCWPLLANVPMGTTVTHSIKLSNNCARTVNFNLVTKLGASAPPGWTYTTLPNKTNFPIDGGGSDLSTYDVTNNGAVDDLDVVVTATALGSAASGELFAWNSRVHMYDHPDETYDISDGYFSTPWLVDTESETGILLRGYGDGLGHFFGGERVRTAPVKPDLTILGEPNKQLNDLKVLFIGSGALSGFDNSPTFRQKLADYVSNGGTIICFGQQYGYEYNALPGEIGGFGWAQDQNCWNDAVTIREVSVVFNGQQKEKLSVNVDGYFTKWPETAKILLNRNENNLPAMLEYTYGQGRVIVSSLYSDWGYRYGQSGDEEQLLMKQILKKICLTYKAFYRIC